MPLTVEFLKQYLYVSGDAEDATLSSLLDFSASYVSAFLGGRKLEGETITETLEAKEGKVFLSFFPLDKTKEVTVKNNDGEEVNKNYYEIDYKRGIIKKLDDDTYDVTYTYEAIPETILDQARLDLIAYYFNHRDKSIVDESVKGISFRREAEVEKILSRALRGYRRVAI